VIFFVLFVINFRQKSKILYCIFLHIFWYFRDQAIAILKQQVRQSNTAREALKRDDKYINASDDEKSGNSVGQLKSIIEHQKDSLRKVKREMCHAEQKHTQLWSQIKNPKFPKIKSEN